jgi:hypothetical protein
MIIPIDTNANVKYFAKVFSEMFSVSSCLVGCDPVQIIPGIESNKRAEEWNNKQLLEKLEGTKKSCSGTRLSWTLLL